MELPISPASYQASPDALVRAIHHGAVTLARTAAEEEEIAGSTVLSHPGRPGVRAINFAASLTLDPGENAAEKIDAILQHVANVNAICQAMLPAESPCEPALEKAILARSYQAVERQVFALANYQPGPRAGDALQIIPARSLYSQLDAFYRDMAVKEHHADDRLARDFAATMIDFLDEPRLEVFIARQNGQAVGAAGVLGVGDIGVIIPAWTDPVSRGKGIAKALMTHVLDHAMRALFKQVILDRSTTCPAIPFYESLGFTRVAAYVKYRRQATG